MNSDSNFGEEIKIMFGKITEEILMNLEKGYDSEINIRADNQALTSLVNSNYSTSEYNAYLEKLYKNEDYAITHPDQEKRLANLKNKIPKSSAGLAMKNRTKRFTDIFAIK
jgi:predicted Zn-dependent protease